MVEDSSRHKWVKIVRCLKDFVAVLTWETTLVASWLLSCTLVPFWKGSYSVRKDPVSTVSILYKSIAGRYRPIRVADGPITALYIFINNSSWGICSFWVDPFSEGNKNYFDSVTSFESVPITLRGLNTCASETTLTRNFLYPLVLRLTTTSSLAKFVSLCKMAANSGMCRHSS